MSLKTKSFPAPKDADRRLKQLRRALLLARRALRRIFTANRKRRRAIKRLSHELGPRLGVDFGWGRPSPAALRDAGVSFVMRYYSPEPAKNLTLEEARSYARAGLDLVALWEGSAAEAMGGTSAAVFDAHEARRLSGACHQPPNTPIVFAVGDEATLLPYVENYFRELNDQLPHSRVWAYADYQLLKELFDAGLISGGFQTAPSWSDGLLEPRAAIQQFEYNRRIDGVEVDYDRSTRPYFGQWQPLGR